jgi:3-dehydroquinate synthase
MKQRSIKVELPSRPHGYEIVIGDDVLAQCGLWARKCLGAGVAKVVLVSNPTVYGLYGRQIAGSLRSAGFSVSHFLMKDGERFKTLRTAGSALKFFTEEKLSRADAIVALGGGVVGDLAGFAASVYLRGIPYLQIPTTLLAMIDSSVGGKTGVNTSFGKNLIGTFHQPRGVLIDVSVLRTLPGRELTAGFCEAVKQAAVGGKQLLEQTGDFLTAFPLNEFADKTNNSDLKFEISDLIFSHVEFKAAVVSRDEREAVDKRARRSRKILNFGHTLAHALEKVTDYRYFRHGEAVGYGVLFAAELSKSLALCGKKDVELLYDVVHRAGPLPALAGIDENEIFEAFRADKKNLAGELQMVLLKGIGNPVILPTSNIPRAAMKKALKRLQQNMA